MNTGGIFFQLVLFYINIVQEGKLRKEVLPCSSVFNNTMYSYYNIWLKEKTLEPIESLPKETKELYWNIAGRFGHSKENRIKAAKAYYAFLVVSSEQ